MFWSISLAVIIIGTPLLMLATASLMADLGVVPVVTGGLVLLVVCSAVSIPAAASMVATVALIYFVYHLVNRISATPDQ